MTAAGLQKASAARRLQRSGLGEWKPSLVVSVEREGDHHAERDDYFGTIPLRVMSPFVRRLLPKRGWIAEGVSRAPAAT